MTSQTPLSLLFKGLWNQHLGGWPLSMRASSTHKVAQNFDIMITWQIKGVISPLSQGRKPPNLAGWWLGIRQPHTLIHMTHLIHEQVTNQKRYISTSTRPLLPPRAWQVAKLEWEGPSKMSRDTWQFRNVIFLQPQCLRPRNLAGWVNRLVGRHAHSQMTLLFHGHVTKMLYLHFHMTYGLWHWLMKRKHHLKMYNSRDTSTNWQIENLMPIFF